MEKTETALLGELRSSRRKHRSTVPVAEDIPLTPGQRIADAVAATMGSWRFIIIQSTILVAWLTLNITAWVNHWDP